MDLDLKQQDEKDLETNPPAELPKPLLQHHHADSNPSALTLLVPERTSSNLSAYSPTKFNRMGSYFSLAQSQELELETLIFSGEESTDNGTLMSDEKFAEELQFQETLMAAITISNTSRRDSPPKESKEAGESSKSFCEICAVRRENDQMFLIQNCGHSCCITCIVRYITANITKMGNVSRENSAVITCPVGLDCEGILVIDACREIVPKYLISMWDDVICESMLDASQKFYPYKDCSSLKVNDSGDVIREAECLSCRRLLCVQCNVPWHSGVGCDEFKGMDPSETGREGEDLILHQLAKEEKWQRCPTCKFFVEKTEGCLHMTCRKKGSELMEEPSISLFCDDSSLCLLSDSSGEESAKNGTLMSDEKFAEELQFQETLMASIITSNTSRRDSPPKEEEAGESSKSLCEICAEMTENDQMFPIQNCGHSCCITCIIRYIAANITKMGNVSRENSVLITCPVGLDCEGILGIDPKYLISMWDDVICESMLDASQKFYCPYKDCSSLMVNDSGDVIKEAECLFCRRLLCVQCHVPWHSGVGCDEFKGMDPSERGREDLIVHQLAKEEKWQRCPTCKFFVEKTEGCLHMTCRCGFQFCYACGGTWTWNHGGCR